MNIIFQDNEVNRIVFHFNKAHNQDTTIPMWTIKHKGQTYYVNHIDSQVGFTTKETPDNSHTKGSLQFKGKLIILENNDIKNAIIQ
jgi:hypothetical protein